MINGKQLFIYLNYRPESCWCELNVTYIVSNIAECSTAGSLEVITSLSVLYWWDDASKIYVH